MTPEELAQRMYVANMRRCINLRAGVSLEITPWVDIPQSAKDMWLCSAETACWYADELECTAPDPDFDVDNAPAPVMMPSEGSASREALAAQDDALGVGDTE